MQDDLYHWKSLAEEHIIEYRVEAQIKAGDFVIALKTANFLQEAGDKRQNLGEIAQAQVKAGDIAGALKTIDLMPDDSATLDNKDKTCQSIISAQIDLRDIVGALKTAGLINNAFTKSLELEE